MRAALVACLLLLAFAAACAVAESAGAPAPAPTKNRRHTGMSGKGVWFSLISFVTAIGWITTSERETVRSGGLWAQAGRRAKTAESPKQAEKGSVVRGTHRRHCCFPSSQAYACVSTDRGRSRGRVIAGARHRPCSEQGNHRRRSARCQDADVGARVPVRAGLVPASLAL